MQVGQHKVRIRIERARQLTPLPHDYLSFLCFRLIIALDIAQLITAHRLMLRWRLAWLIERLRLLSLAIMTGGNLGLSIWYFADVIGLEGVGPAPPPIVAALCLLLSMLWYSFTTWWSKRGLDLMLGL